MLRSRGSQIKERVLFMFPAMNMNSNFIVNSMVLADMWQKHDFL